MIILTIVEDLLNYIEEELNKREWLHMNEKRHKPSPGPTPLYGEPMRSRLFRKTSTRIGVRLKHHSLNPCQSVTPCPATQALSLHRDWNATLNKCAIDVQMILTKCNTISAKLKSHLRLVGVLRSGGRPI